MGDMMAKRSAFLDIIKDKGALVLDGALGTELERYGCDIQHKLWSVLRFSWISQISLRKYIFLI
mgnify:CR=1 FL=1